MRVTKHIPPGAGLGGGSADAAAVLRWAGWTDLATAAELGADVPFCLVGGRARVGGVGELVEPQPFEESTLTLLTPPFGCSTPAVYRRWDELGGPRDERPDGNDLTAAALAVEPRLVEWRDRLADATGHDAPPGRQRLHLVRRRRVPGRRAGGQGDPARGDLRLSNPRTGFPITRIGCSAPPAVPQHPNAPPR